MHMDKVEQTVYGLKGGEKEFCAEDYVGNYHGKDVDTGSYKK
jgi:hypothetical protein